MKYNALLFCPDEKTARVVTQVLTDLEFRVEPCNEPFAAVKKLMAEHFDAIVVGCDSEQNAALLFKSAHNSGVQSVVACGCRCRGPGRGRQGVPHRRQPGSHKTYQR